jgi:hypothetical protein
MLIVAEHGFPPGREISGVLGAPPIPQPFVRALHGESEPFLAFPQSFLGGFTGVKKLHDQQHETGRVVQVSNPPRRRPDRNEIAIFVYIAAFTGIVV